MIPSSTSIDTLPLDVWHHIFSFACTDGGRTGARLARTSRAVRASAAAYRFHSVELYSIRQLAKFLSAYEAALAAASTAKPPTDPPHVRHLTFAFLPPKVDMVILDGAIHFRDYHSWQQAKIAWNTQFVTRVARLFTLVASHLATLTVLQSPDVPLPFVPCAQPFPALCALTLVTDDSLLVYAPLKERAWMEPTDSDRASHSGAGAPPTCAQLAAAPPFPALERLHLADGKWQHTLPMWAAAAPRVAHLRISGADEEAVAALRDLLRVGSPDLAALCTVVVHPKFEVDAAKAEAEKEELRVVLHEIRAGRAALDVEVEPALAGLAYDLKRRQWTVQSLGE